MDTNNKHIPALLEALALTPGNAPLRRMLAKAYQDSGDAENAETEYTEALRLDPDDIHSKLGLANAYLAQGKTSLGLVLVEDVLSNEAAPPEAFFTHSHLLVRTGRIEDAVQAYTNAVALNESIRDEVDALAASRSDMRQSAGRHLINQFLSELDGVEYDNDGVLILAATNAPWHLDSAFRRPGRFDRVIFVPPPDLDARKAILGILLRDKPVESIDTALVAKKAKDFSGADLMAVVDRCVENKLSEAMNSGIPTPIITKDLLKVVKQQNPTTKEWFATARNHALFANEGGIYDDVLNYLGIKK